MADEIEPRSTDKPEPEPETVGVGAAKKSDGEHGSSDEDTSPHDDTES